MAPNFQSSFIPKEPITNEVFKKKKAGFFGILAVSLFVATLVISVALYVYKGILKNEIESTKLQLAEAEKNIDKKTIDEMSQFSQKLNAAKTIVAKHQVVSNFLKELASSTVSTISFTDFSYGDLTKEGLMVVMNGEALNYADVALQEDIFLKDKYFKSVVFSDLSLGESGRVSFEVKIIVDPKISIYE